jgi:hypothetical protein
MRTYILFYFGILFMSLLSCAPIGKIATHDFSSGYYKLKTRSDESSMVYLNVIEDLVIVYPTIADGKDNSVDTTSYRLFNINDIKAGNEFYGSSFVKKSADIDLATILLKYRPSMGEVPGQLNANLNAALYVGFRKDFYKMITNTSPLHKESTNCRHTGFDFGLFAGMGITQINPTVTGNKVPLEYDGIVLQKGIGAFVTFERMSVGIVLGFDNLLDENKTVWLYNQKPYLGLSIGIANF